MSGWQIEPAPDAGLGLVVQCDCEDSFYRGEVKIIDQTECFSP